MSKPELIPAREVDAPPPRRRGIKNLAPGLVERGKIKIGAKGAVRQKQGGGGTYQMPTKLDHFLITTMERGQDNNFLRDEQLHGLLGDKPREIPVVLIYDDIDLNFQTRYAAYAGRTLWCSGDGEVARRAQKNGDAVEYTEVQCPCHRQDPTYTGRDKCKINGTLSVMIRGAEAIGGVWKFRTTSYNSVVGIMSSLALIKRITGGPLAGIPLMMTLTPKAVTDPVGGGQQTVYVVGIEYRGGMESLQDQGHNLLLNRTTHSLRIDHIEDEARQLITYAPQRFAAPDDIDDEVEEFYPEVVEGDLQTAAPANDNEPAVSDTPPAARKPAGGANALNAAAMTGGRSRALENAAEVGREMATRQEPEQRIAGRLTYWIDEATGEHREIAKGEAIPDNGETVSKARYEEFIPTEPPADEPPPHTEADMPAGDDDDGDIF